MTIDSRGNYTANPENVENIQNFFLARAEEYLTRGEETNLLDLFMGVHSFHKMIVVFCGKKWLEEGGVDMKKTYQMADLTFRSAMRELRRENLTAKEA